MKPLKLTVYPFQVDEHGRTRYYHPGSFPLPNLHTHPKQHIGAILTGSSNIGTMREQKRLTTAELAAEYWRAQDDVSCADDPSGSKPGTWPNGYDRENGQFLDDARLETLERFATLPSYDEVPE